MARKTSGKRKPLSSPSTLTCIRCGEKLNVNEFYNSHSDFFTTYMKIPFCKECINVIYDEYYEKYKTEGYTNPDRKAVERVCMITDLYYSDKIFDSVQKTLAGDISPDATVMSIYYRTSRLNPNTNKKYDNSLYDKYNEAKSKDAIMSIYTDDDIEQDKRVRDGIELFGSGFEREDYIYLYNEYMDWTSRHECDTKSKEELIKQICFVQLDLFKANRAGRDTKDLNRTLTTLMDAAKLQPKQNTGDTTAQNQTLGTLIDKWENTRPIPEIDDELKDVDKIGLYLEVFFKGHLAKMLGIKNAFSRLYNKFMDRYTVTKPEYTEEEDNEALFDAVFGSASLEDDIQDNINAGDFNG